MNMVAKFFVLGIIIALLSACNHEVKTDPLLKVYKFDESIQCENTAVELDVMMLELVNSGIDVICSQKGHDGMARVTVCGADTGNINIYEINRVNLPDAEAIGFESVSNLSQYQDQKCV